MKKLLKENPITTVVCLVLLSSCTKAEFAPSNTPIRFVEQLPEEPYTRPDDVNKPFRDLTKVKDTKSAHLLINSVDLIVVRR